MNTPLKIYLDPPLTRGDLNLKACGNITFESLNGACLVVGMDEDMTIKGHLQAIKNQLGSKYEVSLEPIKGSDEPPPVPVWESIFTKPEPVTNLLAWNLSDESDRFLFTPNDRSKDHTQAEACQTNALMNEILLNSYQQMMLSVGVNFQVRLHNGLVVWINRLNCMDALQVDVEGGKVARLCNSKLVEGEDDSMYAKGFIHALESLPSGFYENEALKVKALARVETILLGHTNHCHNQRFIQRFQASGGVEMSSSVVPVLSAMMQEGFVMEKSLTEFKMRLDTMRLGDLSAELSKIYESCYSEVGHVSNP